MKRAFLHGLLSILLAGGAASPVRAQPPRAEPDFRALEALDARVATVGHRLAVANVGLCAARQWRHGIVFIDLADVVPEYRAAVSRVFGPETGLGVAALVADGPAASAGLRSGDVVLSVDGQALAATPRRPVEQQLDLINTAFADGAAIVAVRRAGAVIDVPVQAVEGCASRIEVNRSRSRQGRADGNIIQINLGLVEYAADDGELAAVMAHEFAHNILGHRARLDAAGVSRGFFGNFGPNARRIRETEIEADRLCVYLMDRAGYDVGAALRFWARFGRSGLNFLGSSTHPDWRSRIEVMGREIAAIRAARAAGRTPVPPFAVPGA